MNNGSGTFWSFCITYLEDTVASSQQKVDYMQVLDKESYDRFTEMRKVRKRMAGLGHYVKERLQCCAYLCYMDDPVLWHRDKAWLLDALCKIEEYLEKHLMVELKPALLNRCDRALPFCGYLLFPHYTQLSPRSRQRYFQKMQELDAQYHSGALNEGCCQRRALPLVAFTRHADALVFRKKVLARLAQANT